jgi:hypothetical protein
MLMIDLKELLKNYDLILDNFKNWHNLDKLNFKVYDKIKYNLIDDLTLDVIYNDKIDILNQLKELYSYNNNELYVIIDRI